MRLLLLSVLTAGLTGVFGANIVTTQDCAGASGPCEASGSITGFGTNQLTLTVTALGYNITNFDSTTPYSASVDASATAVTFGVPRTGVLMVLTNTGNADGTGTMSLRLGSQQCTGYDPLGCHLGLSFLQPFELGVPFLIGGSAGFFNANGMASGDGTGTLTIALYESADSRNPVPGAPVTIYDQADVPEPATAAMLGAGLAIVLSRSRRRR